MSLPTTDTRPSEATLESLGRELDAIRDRVLADLAADRSAFEDFDADKAGERGYGFGRLGQLAVEHLMGAR